MTFEVVFDTIDTIDSGTLRFSFDAENLTLTLFEKTFLHIEMSFQGKRIE